MKPDSTKIYFASDKDREYVLPQLKCDLEELTPIKPIREGFKIDKELLIINRIEDGFADCEYFFLEGKDLDYRVFMLEVFALNGENNSYADFYYGRLNLEQKESLKQSLSKEELRFLDRIQYGDGIYFPLTEDLMLFLLNITIKEILFSTFYFTKYPCTIWGNYNKKFPMFFLDKETKSRYKNLANSCSLVVSDL